MVKLSTPFIVSIIFPFFYRCKSPACPLELHHHSRILVNLFLIQGIDKDIFQFYTTTTLYRNFVLPEVREERIRQWFYYKPTLFTLSVGERSEIFHSQGILPESVSGADKILCFGVFFGHYSLCFFKTVYAIYSTF